MMMVFDGKRKYRADSDEMGKGRHKDADDVCIVQT
jgi:hypothetical protein